MVHCRSSGCTPGNGAQAAGMSRYWALRLYQNDVAPSHYERTNVIGLPAALDILGALEKG